MVAPGIRSRAVLLVLIAAVCAAGLLTSRGHTAVPSDGTLVLHGASTPPDSSRPGCLLVGYGQADMTPPPGLGLNGGGPGARVSRGWRGHLYARAMVLQDSSGHAVAFVTGDMAHMSLNVHRRVAARLLNAGIPLGSDRLFISATHSHSAGGNTLEASAQNAHAGPLAGFDAVEEEFFVEQFCTAISDAWRDRASSTLEAKWARVPGVTWNRSLSAHLMNPDAALDSNDSPSGPYADESVDRDWFMLRVNRLEPGTGLPIPYGAYSSFAIHPTGNPSYNELFDPDVIGFPTRALAAAILRRRAPGTGRDLPAFHLMASGTAGDVAPNLDGRGSTTEPYDDPVYLRLARRPSGPRTPVPPEKVVTDEPEARRRLRVALRNLRSVGDTLSAHAARLFEAAPELVFSSETEITSRLMTVDLHSVTGTHALCPEPEQGVSTAAGAEGLRTPVHRWKLLGLIPLTFEEGGRAIDYTPTSCQGAKRVLFGSLLQRLATSGHQGGFPRYAQLMTVRLRARDGSALWICGLPGEISTQLGRRMRAAVAEAVDAPISRVRIVGLTNGYLGYVTTAEEYSLQHYEGGSMLYGPNEGQVLLESLTELARSVEADLPVPPVPPVTIDVGGFSSHFPTPAHDTGAPRHRSSTFPLFRRADTRDLGDGTAAIRFRWIDGPPGTLRPSDGLLIRISSVAQSGNSTLVASDDSASVEVRVVDWEKDRATWEVTWIAPLPLAAPRYRLEIDNRGRPARPFRGEFDRPDPRRRTRTLPVTIH